MSSPTTHPSAADLPTAEFDGRNRLSNAVATRITGDILAGGLAPGTMIGMEPELMVRYGVGRATLREAVRQLEVRGVARMRRGTGGGLIASGTPVSIAAGTLATYFEFSAVTLADLVRARAEFEAMAVGMAATRVDDDDVETLRRAVASWEGRTDPLAARQFHFGLRETIARMSGSPMVELATSAFQRVTADLSSLLTGGPEVVQRYIADQREQKTALVEAIVSGDASGATAMVRQEGAGLLNSPVFAPYLDFALPDLVLESGRRPSIQRPADDKLGITTALRLRQEIVARGWREGQPIGTERQLRARYGVSRGLLREALMLLEINGVVQIQRGRVGGIVVGRPSPVATIAATLSHMLHMDLADKDLRNIVATVDTLAVGPAAELVDADRLAALLEGDHRAIDYEAVIRAIYPPPEKRSAELICDLVRAYKPELGRPPEPGGGRAHWAGLRAALVAGDASLARRHMRGLWGRLDSTP